MLAVIADDQLTARARSPVGSAASRAPVPAAMLASEPEPTIGQSVASFKLIAGDDQLAQIVLASHHGENVRSCRVNDDLALTMARTGNRLADRALFS